MRRRHALQSALLPFTGLASASSLAGLALTAAPLPLRAQTGVTRLIVPYPPGGPLDGVARALAEAVRPALGTVIVENRPGAGGNLGADAVARAAPDGRTLLIGAVATHAINPWLYRRMPYDPVRDFTPLTLLARTPNVLVMSTTRAAELGIGRVADLVAYAKRHPDRLNYGSGGNGSAGHLAGELFKSKAGVSMVHIPYAGGNPAQLALLAGEVDLSFDNLATASANIAAGRLKALAVTTARRSALAPTLPTLAEEGATMGLAGFDIDTWFGLFAPAGLPDASTRACHQAAIDALATPAMRTRLASLLAEPAPMSPQAFASFVQHELAKYEGIVKASGATID
jgi:tripartite-type tricarboxylate transporter receptor subunit TctC